MGQGILLAENVYFINFDWLSFSIMEFHWLKINFYRFWLAIMGFYQTLTDLDWLTCFMEFHVVSYDVMKNEWFSKQPESEWLTYDICKQKRIITPLIGCFVSVLYTEHAGQYFINWFLNNCSHFLVVHFYVLKVLIEKYTF